MFGLSYKFEELDRINRPIKAAVIGVGQMGRALVAQLLAIKGITPAVIIDHKLERILSVLKNESVQDDMIVKADSAFEADNAVREGKIAISTDDKVATFSRHIDIVVDATGSPEGSVKIALDAIANRKHIIMMTVETDVVVGPILKQMADEAGVIFSGMAGDEPGAIMELYDFAKSMGLEVLALGKGKNNPVNYEATPDTAYEEAVSKNMNPRMLASFQDCTKTMIELAAVSNATGFLPDCMGAHGVKCSLNDIPNKYRLESEGGILRKYGVVDYIDGIAPGVFAVVTSDNQEIKNELKYLSMGDGPHYLLYRPYHLCSLEIPITIGRIVLHKTPSIVPAEGAPYADVIAFAKKDLKSGEKLDGIGGFTVYGVIASHVEAKKLSAVPVGIINSNTVMKNDVKKGEIITYDDVILDENSALLQLRRVQESVIG